MKLPVAGEGKPSAPQGGSCGSSCYSPSFLRLLWFPSHHLLLSYHFRAITQSNSAFCQLCLVFTLFPHKQLSFCESQDSRRCSFQGADPVWGSPSRTSPQPMPQLQQSRRRRYTPCSPSPRLPKRPTSEAGKAHRGARAPGTEGQTHLCWTCGWGASLCEFSPHGLPACPPPPHTYTCGQTGVPLTLSSLRRCTAEIWFLPSRELLHLGSLLSPTDISSSPWGSRESRHGFYHEASASGAPRELA